VICQGKNSVFYCEEIRQGRLFTTNSDSNEIFALEERKKGGSKQKKMAMAIAMAI
jgi:hypothetical protein